HVAPRETGVDRRGLSRFRIVKLQPPLARIDRVQLGRRMIRYRLAKIRRTGLTDPRRGPYARLLIHREAVDRRLAVPDRFVAPERRGRRRLRGEGTRRLRIANLHLYLAGRIGLRIEDSQVIAAFFER